MMSFRRPVLLAALALLTAEAAHAQTAATVPPALDPEAWWAPVENRPTDVADPLGGRRANRSNAVLASFNNGVDPSLYRLWGLQPVQGLTLRRSEAVYEVWYRPSTTVRQAVVRVTLRGDGRAFVQARAGLGCCTPEIARRVDVDAELPAEVRQRLLRLRQDPLWTQPRNVVVREAEDTVTTLCVTGAAYDLTLVEDRRAAHVRRACDPAELGSAGPVLEAVIGAALGRDPRFDAVFSRQRFADFTAAYQALLAEGGRLDPEPGQAQAPLQALAAPAEAAEASAEAQTDAAAEVMAADRAFAARASQATTAQAFREFMAEDGLLFRADGEPLRGPAAIFAHFGGAAPETGKLLWEPAQAWVSEDGTFGASWGRSRFVLNGAAQPSAAYRYMTVWRRDADGRWKGLMEMGAPAKDLLPAASAQKPPPASR
jgi:ketosteroid isomerase-like protein